MDPPGESSGSLPSVQLPLVETQATADTQRNASQQSVEMVDDEDLMDEKDLFGSDDEAEEAGVAAPGDAAPVQDEAPDEVPHTKDLFGSDEEYNEKDLFGSDEEAEATGVPAPGDAVPVLDQQPPSRAGTAEPSEMDEREIFGADLSDDEPGGGRAETEEMVVRKRPLPPVNRQMTALRLPSILAIEKTPFSQAKFSEDVRNGFKEFLNTKNKQTQKLLNAENVIRWRFKKNEEGQILTGHDGRPQYESNSRIVEWEDGTKTLYVGAEAYPLREMPDNVFLFEENSPELSVCHGVIQKRYVAVPTSLKSQTHKNVQSSQFNKFEASSRSLLVTSEDQAILTQQRQLELEQEKRAEQRERKALLASESPQGKKMSAAFLEEEGDGGDGPSVKRPKLM